MDGCMQRRAAPAISVFQALISLLLLPTLVNPGQAQEADITLVLNEFMASNTVTIQDAFGDYDDWIEIYNHGLEAVDLSDMYLTDDLDETDKWRFAASDPDLTTIPAGGYLLIWADNEPEQGPLHAPFKLSAGGEQIGLYDQEGRLIDAIRFGPQLQDVAMARERERWRMTELPTPGRSNTIGTGEPVLITEIMYNPSIEGQVPENLAEEFIEIHNQGAEPVDMSTWRLVRGINFQFPEQTWLEAGAYIVVAADVDTFQEKYPEVGAVLGPWDGRLSNSGETIELVDTDGQTVDRLHYADQGDWAQRILGPWDNGHRGWTWQAEHDGLGRSLELMALNRPNEYGQNWDASQIDGGTPGQANSISQATLAPMIVDVAHAPPLPTPQDRVLVSADIIGTSSSNLNVTLSYRSDPSTYTSEANYPTYDPNAFIHIPMYDNGTHGDDRAFDHQYSALIPAQVHNTVVEFFVQVCDTDGQCRTWPAPALIDDMSEQVVNALYLVQDGTNPSPLDPSRQPTYHVIMTHMERRRLADIGDGEGGEHNSDAKMNATFISVDQGQTRVRYCSGVRNRGHGSRRNQPNNMRVDFPHDHTWKSVRSINLNAQYTHVQVAGSALCRLAGLPTAEATPVQVRINGANLAQSGSRMYGAYVHVEVIDSDFVQRSFPQDDGGNLYKCMRTFGPEANLTYRGDQADDYRLSYLKRTNKGLDDYSDVIDLCYAMDASPDETYLDEVQRVAQVDQWLRYLAINALLNNTETSLGNGRGDDYYFYRGVTDPRFVLIPHDLDSILRGDTRASIFRSTNLRTIARLLNVPAYASRYYYHLQDLIQTTLARSRVAMVLKHLLGDYVPEGAIQNMVDFQGARNDYVLSLIQAELTIQTDFPLSSDYYVADANNVILWGTADPTQTQSVLVNGLLAQWSPLDGQWLLSDPAHNQGEMMIPRGSVWKYFDLYTDLGPEWYVGVDDTDWPAGPAELGYGDEETNGRPEVTTIGFIDMNPDTPELERNLTTYFTHNFMVDDPTRYERLSLRILRDDGAVVYLNGSEIARSNMTRRSVIDYYTPALAGVSGQAETFFYGGKTSVVDDDFTRIDLALLIPGLNQMAVEIHQRPDSRDISFDLELLGIPRERALLTLQPGINRVVAQAFDGPNGTGREVEREEVDFWYQVENPRSLGGHLNANTVLDAASGPWLVTETLSVASGITLTIEPGVTVFFHEGTGITVPTGARLVAEGTPQQHIRLTHPTVTDWNGILLDHSLEDNRLCYVDCEFGNGPGPAITLESARVLLDHVTWPATDARVLELYRPRAVIRACIFPSISDTEPVHGSGLSGDEYLVFDACVFGTAAGYNDIIDFSGGQRPGPILQIYDCVFLGGSDDGVDLDGADAHIEGNTFMDFRNGPGSNGTSNAVTTGKGGADAATVYLARNIFAHNDYAVLVKEDGELIGQHNTFVNNTVAAISFGEPFRSTPRPAGQGALLEGNILWNNTAAFAHYFQDPPDYGPEYLSINHSILPEAWLELGHDNLDADPLFVDAHSDFHLRPGSNALGTGPGGVSMGAYVGRGASIAGEPSERTHHSSVTLTVGGPGISAYRYSLNDPAGPFSHETPVENPLELDGLTDGQTYRVYVLGKNSAGVWQDSPTASQTWTVDSSYTRLVINEILVVNTLQEHSGTLPALLELYYDGPAALDLSGHSLGTDPNSSGQYLIPSGTSIQAQAFHTLAVHTEDTWYLGSPLPEGLVLDPNGGELHLFDRTDQPVDTVRFGRQLVDLSIGRFGSQQSWRLCRPTLGSPNQMEPTGDPARVRINEWLANSEPPFASDFIELFNPSAWPVNLGDYYLTDAPIGEPAKFRLPPCSFIEARGFLVLQPDGQSQPGHLDFNLSANGEMLALSDQDLQTVDQIIFRAQHPNVSAGRVLDGADRIEDLNEPTPGAANTYDPPQPIADTQLFLPMDQVWAYDQMDLPLDPDWILPTYDDTDWARGPALLYVENSDLPAEKQTPLVIGAATYYFRTQFQVDQPTDVTALALQTVIDDGAIVYLNGVEILRLRMPPGPVDHFTLSEGSMGNAILEGPFEVSPSLLMPGTNTLAAEVHQASMGSSDIVFGLKARGRHAPGSGR